MSMRRPTIARGWPRAQWCGPAVIEEEDSTAVIGPGATATVDGIANLVVQFD